MAPSSIFKRTTVALLGASALLGSLNAVQAQNGGGGGGGGGGAGPNVVVIMSDDQDLHLDSLSAMPKVTSLIGGAGINYDRHYCTVAWCCPSRVSFFTGRAAHNTNVTSIAPPYGGWQKFTAEGLNANYLPVWLQDAGINTYYVGKFMNGFGKQNLATPEPPRGWTDSSFLVDPFTYNYYASQWTSKVNAASSADVESHKGEHTTDVTEQKALAFLDDAAKKGGQFFLQVATVAPHLQVGGGTDVPPPPSRYVDTYAGTPVPQTDNFNPDVPSGASWVRDRRKLGAGALAKLQTIHSARLGNIRAIDDLVGNLIDSLESKGLLDNTYIIYTTDNGFHLGNHRLNAGKRCPYEEDINIPLLIRGPGVSGGSSGSVTNHADLAPTILDMLGVPARNEFDGWPVPYGSSAAGSSEHVQVEFWNSDMAPQGMAPGSIYNNTYKALRYISGDQSLFYSVWCTGEHEFYDMNTDPGQMTNQLLDGASSGGQYYGRPFNQLISRLDALLLVTKGCTQVTCREPWTALFPDGSVSTLSDAMDDQYDSFFKNQPKVEYSTCVSGYIIGDEGPQDPIPYGGGKRRAIGRM